MKLYRLAWLNNAEYFEASTKYLQLADKAARTVAMLTERLDHHRNQGKQQIVVQHTTTVNATQAVVTDSVVKGKTSGAPSARLLAAVTDKPMEILETVNKRKLRRSGEGIRKRNEHQPHAQGSRRTPDAPPDQNGQDSVVVRLRLRGWKVCRMHGARGGAPEGKRNGNYRHGARSKEMIDCGN